MGFKMKRSIMNWKHGVLTRYTEDPGVYNVIIPDGVTEIGEKAFEGCRNLKRIVIPDGVTTIGENAFAGCFSLTSIIIPGSVTKIGESAFSWCVDLADISIPNSVTEIGAYAFHHCASLTSIAIPSGVTVINENVFDDCESLSHITIPNSVTVIDSEAFLGCTSLANIDLPDSVAEFGHSIFMDCTSLSSVVIPDGIPAIYIDTFSGCTNLTSAVVPDSVAEIHEAAFKGCANLTIIGSDGSYAQTFAKRHGIPFAEKNAVNLRQDVPVPGGIPLADPMPFAPEGRAERKVFLFVHQDMQFRSFDSNFIYIGKNGETVLYSETIDVYAIVVLSYDVAEARWSVVGLNSKYSVWLNGIRLRAGVRYFIPAINTIDVRGVTKFAVEYLPDLWKTSMDAAWFAQSKAVEALEAYTRCANTSIAGVLFSLITTMPLFAWGGIHSTGDGSETTVYIPPIPARIDPTVRYDTNYLNEIQYREDLELLLPLFTSEEEACKGGTNLGAFLYDYPLPMFQLIMKTGRGIIIDPFSDHAQILSGDSLKMVWNSIREQNYLDDCPGPCWVTRTIL